MKLCHVCAAECADDAELCPVCGAELLYAPAAEEREAEFVEIKDPVLAASVEDLVTAEIFRDVLRDNGIASSCDEQAEEATLKLTFGGGLSALDVYVERDQLERAQEIYQEVLAGEPTFDDDFPEAFEGENGEDTCL